MAGVPAFTGITGIISGRMTYNAHGLVPSVCTITAPPQAIKNASGTLSFRDTDSGAFIQFNRCLVDSVSYQGSRPVVMVVRILDERWSWANHQITGAYNVREPDGEIRKSTKKTTQELATLLLQAMGIDDFSVANLPIGSHPEMIWDYANAANELSQLCSSLGCRPVRELSGRVVIHRNGIGNSLPSGRNLRPDATVDPANKPSEVKIALGPTEYEYTFDLVPVAEQSPGKFVALDAVDYKPKHGWSKEDPAELFGVTNENPAPNDEPTSRQLALRSVYRAYRIDATQEFKIKDTEFAFDDILPIRDVLIASAKSDDGSQQRLPAFVKGTHWDGSGDFKNKDQVVVTPFQILPELGIVLFSEPVYKINGTDSAPADLKLKTTFNLTDQETGIKKRKAYSMPVPGALSSAGIKLLERTEINLQVRQNGTDNEKEVKKEAEYYLAAEIASYQTVTAGSITLSGIVPFVPDGALSQASWNCGSRVPATTTISRNNEIDPFTPSYKQRQKKLEEEREKQQLLIEARRKKKGAVKS